MSQSKKSELLKTAFHGLVLLMGPFTEAEKDQAMGKLGRALNGLMELEPEPAPAVYISAVPSPDIIAALASLDEAQGWLAGYLMSVAWPTYNGIVAGPGWAGALAGAELMGLPVIKLPPRALVPVIWPQDIYKRGDEHE